MSKTDELIAQWVNAKENEKSAIERRREIEDALVFILDINVNDESTTKHENMKIQTRLTRKVDSDLAQEIAQEYGLTEYLHTLFRWKPEIDIKAWKAVDDEVKAKLAPAITVSASRPSFTYQG